MPLKPPRPDRHAAIEVNAARGPHTPPPQPDLRPRISNPPPPPRGKLDSVEVSADSILVEYKAAADRARASEAREGELKLKLAASESGVSAYGPKVSLGSAKWWCAILGAIAIAAPQVKELVRPSASAVQIAAVQESLAGISKRLDARDATFAAAEKADAKRWTISAAFACSQGFRARGLDCDSAQSYADIQPVPLKPKASPQWKATATWPTVAKPED